MVDQNTTTGTLRLNVIGEKAIDGVRRSLDRVNSQLRNTAAASGVAAEGAGHTSRRMQELAGSTGAASAGLTNLQANLAATRVAQEALGKENRSLQDSLNSLAEAGQEPAAKQAISEITQSLQGSFTEVEGLNNELGEFLDTLDEDDLESFFAAFGGVDDVFDPDSISLDPDSELSDLQKGFAAIESDSATTLNQLNQLENTLGDLEGETILQGVDRDFDGIHEDIQKFVTGEGDGADFIQESFQDAGLGSIEDIAGADEDELSSVLPSEFPDDQRESWVQSIQNSAQQVSTEMTQVEEHLDIPSLDPEQHFGKGVAGKLSDDLGIEGLREVTEATTDDLTELYGVGEKTAEDMLQTAEQAVSGYDEALRSTTVAEVDPFEAFPEIFGGDDPEGALGLDDVGILDDPEAFGLDADMAETLSREFDSVGEILDADAHKISSAIFGDDVGLFEEIAATDVVGDAVADFEEIETVGDLLSADTRQIAEIAERTEFGRVGDQLDGAINELFVAGPGQWDSGKFAEGEWKEFVTDAEMAISDMMEHPDIGGMDSALTDRDKRARWIQEHSDEVQNYLGEFFQQPGRDSAIPSDAPDGVTDIHKFRDEVHQRFAQQFDDVENLQAPALDALDSDFDPAQFQDAVSDVVSDTGVDPRDVISQQVDDDQLASNLTDLVDLMDANDEIRRALVQSDSISEAASMVDSVDADNLRQLDRAIQNHGEGLTEFTSDSGNFLQHLEQFDSKSEVQQAVGRELGDSITQYQNEVLSETLMQLDTMFDPDRTGTDMRDLMATQDTIEMGLIGQLMDADSPDRQKEIGNLLEQLYAGELGIESPQSLLQSDEFLGIGESGARSGTLLEDLQSRLARQFPEKEARSMAEDAVRQIGQTPGVSSIADLTDPDQAGTVTEVVGDAIDPAMYEQFPDATRVVGDELGESLRSHQRLLADRAAPGLMPGLMGTDDTNIHSLLFGGPRGGAADGNQIQSHLNQVNEALDGVREAQDAATVTRRLGVGGRRRGLFGYILYGADGMLTRAGHGAPRHMDRIRRGLETTTNRYQDLLPLLEATSIRLGSVNVNFESMGVMLFKLTAMLGPPIAALLGLASAALTAAGALGAFTAVGAIGFLQQMEDEMAGVNDRQEAMGELMETIKDMAWEATQPLQEARLADGRSGERLFVDALRGVLVLLNRISEVLAHIVELDVFSEELDRLTTAIFEQGEGDWMEGLGSAVERVLPLITDLAIAVINGLPHFIAFATYITEALGEDALYAAQDLSDALSLISMYGAGFMNWALKAARVIGIFVSYVVRLVDVLFQFAQLLPIIGWALEDNISSTNELAFAFGGVIGFLEVFRRVGIYTAKNLYGIYLATKYVTSALWAKTLALKASTGGWLALSKAMAIAAAKFTVILAALMVIANAFGLLTDEQEEFLDSIPIYGDLNRWMRRLVDTVIVLTGAIIVLNKWIKITAFSSMVSLIAKTKSAQAVLYLLAGSVGLLTAKLKVLGATIAGLGLATLGKLAAIVGIAVAATAVLGDILYYMATGESYIGNWVSGIETVYDYLIPVLIAAHGVVAVFADFAYYLATGESYLGNWIDGLELMYDLILDLVRLGYAIVAPWESWSNALDDVVHTLQEIIEYFELIPGFEAQNRTNVDTTGTAQAGLWGIGSRLGFNEASRLNQSGGSGGGSATSSPDSTLGRVRERVTGGSSRTNATVEIVNNGVIGDRDLDRMIERSLDKLLKQKTGLFD